MAWSEASAVINEKPKVIELGSSGTYHHRVSPQKLWPKAAEAFLKLSAKLCRIQESPMLSCTGGLGSSRLKASWRSLLLWEASRGRWRRCSLGAVATPGLKGSFREAEEAGGGVSSERHRVYWET